MTLREILESKGSKVWSVKTSQTVMDTLQVLVKQKIGALLVYDEDDKISGIISERDIMRECYHNREGWGAALVSNVMTRRLIIGTPEDRVDYIMGVMTQNRIRHIPVIYEKELVGIVSIGDVVKAQLKDSEFENRYLKEYLYGG